ncbi:MAG: isochorismatase family protein [candidate division Zixibacteria bacterium]|nr:isochorismatase family protein [candidate division Zixibacteria bacterium]
MTTITDINPKNEALIVIDVQKDFCKGGALEVPEGDDVVEPLNQLLDMPWATIVGTRDWHPPGHSSFKEKGGPWPPHCIQNTEGAEFHPDLNTDAFQKVISKGVDLDDGGYSAVKNTDLVDHLKEHGIKRVFVAGLAANICVRYTVLDLLEEHCDVVLVTDATRGVDIEDGDTNKALQEMDDKGATLVSSVEVRSAIA